MSKLVSYLEELGLTTTEKINTYFLTTEIDVLKTFDEYVGKLVYEDWEISEYSPYLFSPSQEVSGFGGCSDIECRIKRANKFSKFSSLYGDVIYLYIDSITTPVPNELIEKSPEVYRDILRRDFNIIHVYYNLIKRKIARVVPANFSICPHCFNELVKNQKELDIVDKLISEYAEKVIVEAKFYHKENRTGIISVKNLPELIVGHDVYEIVNGKLDVEVLSGIQQFPSVVENKQYVFKCVKNIVYQNYYSSKFEAFMSSTYNSKLITAKEFDKRIFDEVSQFGIGKTPPPVFEMPFLETLDIDTILKLRDQEKDTFDNYRVAMDKATREYLKNNADKANQIYDDIVYPEFVKLDAMFNRTKRMHLFRTIGEIAVVTSTITFGIMNSIIPANPVGIATALGCEGFLVKELNKVMDKKATSDDEIVSKDLYFLWQLKNNK